MIDQTTIDELRRLRAGTKTSGDAFPLVIACMPHLQSLLDAAERVQRLEAVLRKLAENWRESAYRAQKQANLGRFPEGYCATEEVFNMVADEIDAALKEQP